MATLYRKYRSKTFDEIIGQESIVSILKSQLQSNTLPHALLLTGPRGTGKTSLARIIAKSLNCEKRRRDGNPCGECENCKSISDGRFEDLIEIDAASNRGIEEIRQIKENVNLLPLRSKHKIYIIDEVHMLTREAFNALLKVLEEPPEHIIFILCTTEYNKIPATILSRCQKLELSLVPNEFLISKLKNICDQEGVNIDSAGLEIVAEVGSGSFRDSETLLEKVISAAPEDKNQKLSEEDVRRLLGVPPREIMEKFIEGLMAKQADLSLNVLDKVKNMTAAEFLKLVLNELTKDFIKFNDLIKLVLRLEQEVRFTQYGFVVIKSRVIEWCDGASIFNKEEKEEKPNVIEKVLKPIERKIESAKVFATKTNVKPTVIDDLKPSDIKNFSSGWQTVINDVALKNKPLKFILSAVKATSLDDGNVLNISVKMKLHKDLLEKKMAKDLIKESYQKVFGKEPQISVNVEGTSETPKDEASKKDVDLDELFNS